MSKSPTDRPDPSRDPASTTPIEPPRSTVPEAASDTLAGDPALLHAAPPSNPAQTPELPKRPLPSLTGFEVLKELGRGGMGVVYLVRHCQMNRTEALKMILSGDHASPADLARFQTEARTVASLHHSNFVRIYDVGESDGHPYLRLEYVSGGNLEDWLDRQIGTSCLPPLSAARQVEHLARAMHHMHEKGLVHRDLKPANVLVDLPDEAVEGSVKLEQCELKISDFGLAREVRGPGAHTRGIIGTPAYMAPEQAMGGVVDRRVDVYALGAILYRLLTGRAPHDGDDPMSVLARLIQPGHDPLPPSQLRPEVPPELDAICRKSLEKEPARRHATAKELADDLRRFAEGGSGGTIVSSATQSGTQPGSSAARTLLQVLPGRMPAATDRRRRIGTVVALLVLVAALCGVGYVGFERWSAGRAVRQAEAREADERDKEEADARNAMNEAGQAREKSDKKGALQNYWKAEDLFEKLHERYPEQARYVLSLARAHIDEGSLWVDYRDEKEAESDFGTAVELLTKKIAPEAAGDDVGLALADAYHHRGVLQDSLMKWRAALVLYQDALKIREGLWWKSQSDRAFRRDLARSYSSIGDAQLQLGRTNKARESYDQAEKLRHQLVEEDVSDDDARYQLARSYFNKGQYFLWRGDLLDSDKQFGDARRLYEGIVSAHPANVLFKAELADIFLWLAELRVHQDKREDVPVLVAKANAIYDELAGRVSDETASRGGRIRGAVILARLRALSDAAGSAVDAGKVLDQLREFKRYLNVEKRQSTAEDTYNGAVARALQGDREMTLSSLKSAVNSYGYRNFTRLRLDVAFRPLLTKDADFKKDVDHLERAARKADEAGAEESE
jgi:tetratricopeptide (TPR) repeat protein